MEIPILDLEREYQYMKKDIDEVIGKTLSHQKWIFGPEVEELEKRIAEYLGVKYAIGVASGTDALVLSLRALAIKKKGEEFFSPEDEILIPSFTFTATGTAVLHSYATPVFIDIDPAIYTVDPEQLRKYLEKQGDHVVGIIPVHLYGCPADMDEIINMASEYNIFVLEDCAQSFGARWQDKETGSFGDCGAFSFFPTKNLGGFGDGGMVSTNDPQIAELVRMLRKHGGKDKYNVEYIGYNSRLDTLQAAILLAKLKYVDEFNEKRRQIASWYNENLREVGDLVLPVEQEGAYHVYHQYTVKTKKRDELRDYLGRNCIQSMIYYFSPLHKMKVFGGRSKVPFPLAASERSSMEVLSLPIEPLMEEGGLRYVSDVIREFYR